jgi:YD repeat-containing protein
MPTPWPSPLGSPQLFASSEEFPSDQTATSDDYKDHNLERYLLARNFRLPTYNDFPLTTNPRDTRETTFSEVTDSFDFLLFPMPQSGTSRIVFASNRDGNSQIYSINVDGTSLVRLTNNTYNDGHPRWSPNGAKILFQSDRNTPDTGNNDLYVMNADGTGQTRLTTDAADDANAVWSPDGTKIVFQSLRNGNDYQIYTMNADGASQTNVGNSSSADYQPSWSPSGAKIAFASERDHTGAPSVYSMNADGSAQTRLTFSSEVVRDEQPIWSPDATKIAFVSTRDSNKEVYLMNASGSNQARLTSTLENDDTPSWSPDGTTIVFRSERERDAYDPFQQLWSMNADGTNQSLMASSTYGDYSPSWSANAQGNQSPIAISGGPYSGVVAQNVAFSATNSFDPDGSISGYSWNFGDGGTGSGVSPTHSYATPGNYSVSLTVTDNLGAPATANTTTTITTAGAEQYLANFNQSALARQPNANESSYWNDILRAAYPNGQSSMLMAVRELGKTLFKSSEYASRNRDNHWYVYDLYKTYLSRDPDAPGWAFWENELTLNHLNREQLRRAFDECTEFAGIVATLTPTGSPSGSVSSLASARVDPYNQPNNGLASRDAQWSISLLNLPGRAGLDLGLSLSYSSMVWTRSGPYIYFDEDNGWPSPGFHLGFPRVQSRVFDAQAGRNIYLFISGGSRVSLRQMGTSNTYEAADSSYLQLIDYGGSLLVRTTDGTQLSYQSYNNEWRCTQIKDRNGNYLTINYDWLGHITTIFDTLARPINLNYDGNANLLSITQGWTVNGVPTTHTWASFGWTTKTISPSFSGAMVVGASPATFPVISQVGLDDSTHYTFEYNAAGQLNPLRSYRSDNVQRAYTAFDYDSPAADCPRLIDTHTWAENWTGINGVPQEVATIYGAPGDGSYTMTTPDGTLYKEFYGSGYKHGLTTQTEVWSGGVRQKWTVNTWTQDNTGVSYQANPRVTETNVYDASGNRRRATTTYAAFMLPSGVSCPLPTDTREYAADGVNVVRHTQVDYRMNPTVDIAYLDRHVLGLVKEQRLYDVSGGSETLMSKVGFSYDESGSIQGDDAPVRHDNDTSYGYRANFVIGRANLSSVKRYDVTDTSQFTTSSTKYDTSGSVVSSTDPLSHSTNVSYADSFSDGNNSRNTLAYPKTVTDADGFQSALQYNFDFGARTRVQGPPPANQSQGLIQTFAYDSAARVQQIVTTNNNSYSRFFYGPNFVQTFATVNTSNDEAYSIQVVDGLGRVIGVGSNHPGSSGGYSARNTIYDAMGRAVKQSNPTEVTSAWLPTGDDSAGWFYTQQTYDWKGRPRITTNTDLTTKEASYSGCGCAGGEVVTLTDEGTLDGGVPKRRQQKIYSDVLARTVKTEVLNWQGGDPYSTTINSYNARDQVTRSRQFDSAQGTVPSDFNDLSCPSGSCQQTIASYDGYGRLKTKHVPEQDENTVTSYEYNADDTPASVMDARGSIATFSYNSRRLLTQIAYQPSAGVADTPDASFSYDAAGNRLSMTDGMGSVAYVYDQLSRLSSETRQFTGLSGSYTLGYEYNLGGSLKSISDPTGATINYSYDAAGRTTAVSGSSFGGVTQYATNMKYRAWGDVKEMSHGNSHTVASTYNARLQPMHIEIPGIMAKDYQYQADGQLRYSADLLDNRFDRSYSYDHVGRIKEAFSGPLARGQADTTDRPYKEFNQYDAMDHLVGRVGSRHWSQALPNSGVTDDFVNNRNPNWQYDADGRLTDGADIQSTFDAAGQATTVVINAGNNTQTRVFDGDGQQSKLVEVATQDDGAGPYTATTVRYSVSSSVVGDVITELDETGQKRRTFVYDYDEVLAWQQKSGNYEQVSWEYRDASDASFRIAGADGNTDSDRAAEMDPLGSNAGIFNPYSSQGHQHWPAEDGIHPGFADLSSPDCQANGMPVPCTSLNYEFWGSKIASLPGFGTNWGSFTELGLREYEQRQAETLAAYALAQPPQLKPGKKLTPKQRAEAKRKAQKRRSQDAGKGNSEDREPKNTLTIEHFDAGQELWIRFELQKIMTTKCGDAYNAEGLKSPSQIRDTRGIVIRPSTDISRSAGDLHLDAETYRDAQRKVYTGQGGTVFGTDGTLQIYLRANAFYSAETSWDGSFLSLGEVLKHEMIHEFIREWKSPWHPKGHDLRGFPGYYRIMEGCQ